MSTVCRRVVISVIEVDNVVELVGRDQKRSVVRAIRTNSPVRIFTRLGQSSEVVADPASPSIASIDAALWVVAFEAFKQTAKVLVSGKGVGVVGTGCGSNVVSPLIVAPGFNAVVQQLPLPINRSWNRLFQRLLARDQPARVLLRNFRFRSRKKRRIP